MSTAAEIAESHSQLHTYWRIVVRALEGEAAGAPGVELLWGNVAIPFFNAALVTEPVSGAEDWRALVQAASAFAQARALPWFLFTANELTAGAGEAERDRVCEEAGLQEVMRLTGMWAERIADGPEPAGLTMRRAATQADYKAISDINTAAYEMPEGAGDGVMDRAALFEDAFAIVGDADGQTVSCAVVTPADGRLYAAFVATLASHRRRGFAEACLRRALSEAAQATGITRTVLHATDPGRPVYERMGYRVVTTYTVFGQGAH